MNIIVLSVSPEIYSTDRIVEEAENQGCNVRVVNHMECSIKLSKGKVSIFYEGEDITHFPDVIIPRIGASATRHGSAIVKEFEMNGVFTTASSIGIVQSQNKVSTLQIMNRKNIAIPDTVFSTNPYDLDEQIELLGGAPIIIKLQEGTQGMGVMLAETAKSAKSIIDTMQSLDKSILLQEFVKESNSEDIRVIVSGKRIIAAMKRKGLENDFRSNIHRGGTGEKIKLTEMQKLMAIRAANSLDLSIAGVDLITSSRGPLLLEVNSTPGLQGIEECTGINVAKSIIKYIEFKCSKISKIKK